MAEESATLILTKNVITVADLHNEVEMVLQNPDNPTQNLSFGGTKGESSLITNDAKNIERHLIIHYDLINQENMCANVLK